MTEMETLELLSILSKILIGFGAVCLFFGIVKRITQKKCEHCRKLIDMEATRCNHCGGNVKYL